MNPVAKRILIHGGGTALVLGALGLMFAELAAMWVGAGDRPGSAELNQPVSESLRYRVPLMMAFWGFLFVAVMELVLTRFRRPAPLKPAEPVQDDAEKLLNELLAQAEAKMALEAQKAEGRKPEDQQPPADKTEDRGQEPEKKPDERLPPS